jgi:PmbA protein
MKDGLYITSVSGLNSGINGQTLDFSLPCQGYVIKDGKIEKATSMIVMAGNLKTLFNSIVALGNDIRYSAGTFAPSVLVKGISISGK